MESPLENIEHRLQDALLQLTNESTIFERLMYKNVNQHRRALYFRRLCQVRRDLRLLRSAKLTELIQKIVQYPENTLRKPSLQEDRQQLKYVFHLQRDFLDRQQLKGMKLEVLDMRRRLYGVARLLEQMYDPILNASIQVAGLLGQTFFMPFSLTTLSMLARIRVLVLQCLHDILKIFNSFSEWASKKELVDHNTQTVPISVNCKWDGAKLSLAATSTRDKHESVHQGFEESQCGCKYTVLESLVLGAATAETDGTPEDGVKQFMQRVPTGIMHDKHLIGSDLPMLALEKAEYNSMELMDVATPVIGRRDNTNRPQTPMLENQLPPNGGMSALPSQSLCENNPIAGNDFVCVPKVAYVSVGSTSKFEADKKEETPPLKKLKTDSLFDMLLGLADET